MGHGIRGPFPRERTAGHGRARLERVTDGDVGGFERLSRPLLELIQRLTGLETSFVTEIDWEAQEQTVLLALNTGELDVPEGTVTDWSDTMCRQAFLIGKERSADVPTDFPENAAAAELGMRTFFTLPIVHEDTTVGTVCGASRRAVELEPDVMDNVRLIAEALSFQLAAQHEARLLRDRAERAEALSLVDPLTQLPNRRGFTGRLEEELARAARHGAPIAVLAIDLDRFKTVNDSYGHVGGDRVLSIVGDVLRSAARTEDVPARLGGDEFALLLPHCDTPGAEAVAARLADGFARATRDADMHTTLSIGISTSESSPLTSLMADADTALYRGKAAGGDRAVVWAPPGTDFSPVHVENPSAASTPG